MFRSCLSNSEMRHGCQTPVNVNVWDAAHSCHALACLLCGAAQHPALV